MKTILTITLYLLLCFSCNSKIEKASKHFVHKNDYASLQQMIELFPLESDTSYVIKLIGQPTLKTDFDLRYLLDSVSENRCPIGGVFHFNSKGKIDQKWVGEICE